MTALPTRRLGELTDILSGYAFDSEGFNESAGLPVIRIRDVMTGTTSTYFRGAFDSRYLVDRGDILIGMDGEFNRARWRGGKALLNQRVCRITPTSRDLDASYLFHFLPTALKAIENVTPFVTVKHLSVKQIREIAIPLPPVPEQRRIAAILDKADALRAKRHAALIQLDTLTQSVFIDMFGDPAMNPKRWPIELMEDVAEIVSGATPRTDKREFWDGTIAWVTPKELSDLEGIYIADTERHISAAGLQSCAARVLPTGSVLFSSRAPIGHTAICAAPMATNQGFKSFIPRTDRMDAHYLLQWLRLRRSFLEGLGTGATFKEVSKAVVARIEIPVPPLSLQSAFADRMRKLQKLGAAGRRGRALLDDQFAGLQYRAFQGEI
jgi:type I restriction enzyme S subunit